MQAAQDTADFLRNPIGRYLTGASHLIWCHSPSLCGAVHWGVPSENDIREFMQQLDFTRHPAMAPRFDVLMDNRSIERIDTDVLFMLGDFVRGRLEEWGTRIRLQVVMLPEGVSGLLLAGLLPSLGPTHSFRFINSPDEAFTLLRGTEVEPAFTRVQALVETARGGSRLTATLQAFLGREVAASLDTAATALGLSPRSLQRHLAGEGSSFGAEQRRARVRVAAELLRHTDGKLETIAERAGFSSTSRMKSAFRAELGVSPAELRTASKAEG